MVGGATHLSRESACLYRRRSPRALFTSGARTPDRRTVGRGAAAQRGCTMRAARQWLCSLMLLLMACSERQASESAAHSAAEEAHTESTVLQLSEQQILAADIEIATAGTAQL